MRLVITPYTVAAFLLVLGGAGLAALGAHLVAAWARRQLVAGGRVAAVGLALTGAVALNTVVPRACGGDDGVRPLLRAVAGGTCAGAARLQVGLVAVAALGTWLAARAARRRAAPAPQPTPSR